MNYDNPSSFNVKESPDFNPTEKANSVKNQALSRNTEKKITKQ